MNQKHLAIQNSNSILSFIQLISYNLLSVIRISIKNEPEKYLGVHCSSKYLNELQFERKWRKQLH